MSDRAPYWRNPAFFHKNGASWAPLTRMGT